MKLIGEILDGKDLEYLAHVMPKMGNAVLEMTEDQLEFLRGYVAGRKAINDGMLDTKIIAQNALEDHKPVAALKWISAENPPEHWRNSDEDKTLVMYLVAAEEYGVEIGGYIKTSDTWVVLGMPAKVTHWMPIPEPPEVERNE